MLIGGGVSAPSARAAYTVTLLQQGPDVVATGSGSIDENDLTPLRGPHAGVSAIDPSRGFIGTGVALPTQSEVFLFTGFTGPTSFGSGGITFASSGNGDSVGINGVDGNLFVPLLYFGGPLSDTATYNTATFSSLGLTPGTYEWTWGTGANADSFTLQIGPAAAPEPGSLTLLAVGLAGLGMVLRTRHA